VGICWLTQQSAVATSAARGVQSRTAAAYACPYTDNMQTDHVKAALIAAWILAVGGVAYLSGATSFAGWTVVAVLSLVPPAIMMRLWTAPAPSMSESIRDVLR